MKDVKIRIFPGTKKELDEIFKANLRATAEDIRRRFETKWVETKCGCFPEQCRADADAYADTVEFAMANDGEYPEQYYDNIIVPDKTAEKLCEFYKEHNGITKSYETLIRFLYHEAALDIGNIQGIELREVSYRKVPRGTARKTGACLFKPRFFKVLEVIWVTRWDDDGEEICSETYKDSWDTNVLVCQPDRRKNVFFAVDQRDQIVVVSPYQMVRYR